MNLADLPLIGDEDRARASHYAVIARLFQAPPDAAVLALVERTAAGFVGLATPLAQAWTALAAAVTNLDAAAIREEYERLFIGIGRPEIFLYGSFYQAGFLMEEPLADLRDDLTALGLTRRAGVGEPEDHLAAVAEAMRHLIVSGADLGAQHDFYKSHLEPWVGRLADDLEAATGPTFYAQAGHLARAFFAIESTAFAMP